MLARSMTEIADEILHNHDAAAELLEQENAFYITPRSQFMKGWDSVVGALLVYTAIMTPFEISFLGENSQDHDQFYAASNGLAYNGSSGGFFPVFNQVINGFFLIDMILNFFLCYEDPDTVKWVYDNKKIADHYMRCVEDARVVSFRLLAFSHLPD